MGSSCEIYEFKAERNGDSLKRLWLGLALEMFELEHFVLPSDDNGDRWLESVRNTIEHGQGFLLSAQIGEEIAGFVYASIIRNLPLKVTEEMGVIHDLYVQPEYRRRGISRRLLVECLVKLKMNGVKTVRINVLSNNETAINLYENLGFTIYRHSMLCTQI